MRNYVQTQYAINLANYETLKSTHNIRMQKHFHLLEEATNESIAEFVAIDMETEDALGLPFAYKCLQSAETEMVNWALEAIKKHSPKDFDEIEYLRKEAKLYPDIWEKLVSIAFRYTGETSK